MQLTKRHFQATQPWIIIASFITVMVKQILGLCSSITKHPILYFQCEEVMKKVKKLNP